MSYASTVLASSPVGFWELGESAFASPAVDAAGNQNGVYTNTAGLTFGQTGIPGGGGATAVKFTTASKGYVAVANNAAQHVGDTFTLEGWVRLNSLVANQRLFSATSGGAWEMYVLSNGKIEVSQPSLGAIGDSTAALAADGSFHHVAWTKATSTNHLFIDGADVTGSMTNRTCGNTAAWTMGVYSGDNTSGPFDGWMQFNAVYPAALTAATIKLHYRLGANLAPVNTAAPVASGSTTIGSVVSVTNGTWTDAGSPTFTYQWKRNSVPIGGATSSSYTLTAADDTATIVCTVTDTDAVGATSADSNAITDTTPIPAAVTVDDLAAVYAAHISQN